MYTDYPFDDVDPSLSVIPKYVSDVKFVQIPTDTIPVQQEWQVGEQYSFGMKCKKPPPQPFDISTRITRIIVDQPDFDFNGGAHGKEVRVCVTYNMNSRFAIADIDFVPTKDDCPNGTAYGSERWQSLRAYQIQTPAPPSPTTNSLIEGKSVYLCVNRDTTSPRCVADIKFTLGLCPEGWVSSRTMLNGFTLCKKMVDRPLPKRYLSALKFVEFPADDVLDSDGNVIKKVCPPAPADGSTLVETVNINLNADRLGRPIEGKAVIPCVQRFYNTTISDIDLQKGKMSCRLNHQQNWSSPSQFGTERWESYSDYVGIYPDATMVPVPSKPEDTPLTRQADLWMCRNDDVFSPKVVQDLIFTRGDCPPDYIQAQSQEATNINGIKVCKKFDWRPPNDFRVDLSENLSTDISTNIGYIGGTALAVCLALTFLSFLVAGVGSTSDRRVVPRFSYM